MENVMMYLNTEKGCVKRLKNILNNDGEIIGTAHFEYTWDISPIVLNEYSILKLASIAHTASNHGNDHSEKVIQFRIKDVMYNPELYRGSDYGPPILFAQVFGSETSYWDGSMAGLYLQPQTINRITMIVSDNINDPYAGVDIDLKFMIGLVISPYDRSFSATEN
jgi:hypothetical protein